MANMTKLAELAGLAGSLVGSQYHARLLKLAESADFPEIDVDAATKEVQEKSEEQIELETAVKWAARAIAAYKLHQETDDTEWLLRAEDYYHESREHASLASEDGSALKYIVDSVSKIRKKSPHTDWAKSTD